MGGLEGNQGRLEKNKRRHLSGFGSCHSCRAFAAMALGLPSLPPSPEASALPDGITSFLNAIVLPIYKTLSKKYSATKAMKADDIGIPDHSSLCCVTLGGFTAVHIELSGVISFRRHRKGTSV